jgi:hypothetical protein
VNVSLATQTTAPGEESPILRIDLDTQAKKQLHGKNHEWAR